MLRLGEILYLGFIVTVCGLRITPSLKHPFSAKQVALPHFKPCCYSPIVTAYFNKGSARVCLYMPQLCGHVHACISQLFDSNIKHLTSIYTCNIQPSTPHAIVEPTYCCLWCCTCSTWQQRDLNKYWCTTSLAPLHSVLHIHTHSPHIACLLPKRRF